MADEGTLREAIASRDKQVTSLLSTPPAAVKAALTDPPYTSESDETRKMSAKVVVKALVAVPEKEIGSVIAGLSGTEQDLLMKYIYRALEGSESSQQLLKWHAVLTEKAGMGCIMRALSESQRV
mmetsp:Transcript_6146/g.12123  ORF Transcript_6146/g.12123 Transcript_6146/m.12123 type:complete len:124 (-) Transcript_6146:695-1066(-)|eukprot:CAMPEP_0181288876 /NCGR_PEP_ID=MMETSP1101-20121128/577_1 /TAXON_ID=46948 /ORGANISM="Rhodomonas abbreviata, Strain Caron Lab Isolate" /LENGTH=123 /DNA_ID=CAMNT_0023393049 /DNA_START=223 /DNA_END=594 /DNA_ORIENTATION=+